MIEKRNNKTTLGLFMLAVQVNPKHLGLLRLLSINIAQLHSLKQSATKTTKVSRLKVSRIYRGVPSFKGWFLVQQGEVNRSTSIFQICWFRVTIHNRPQLLHVDVHLFRPVGQSVKKGLFSRRLGRIGMRVPCGEIISYQQFKGSKI